MTKQDRTTHVESLRYHVPDRQDPVVVLTALANAGYEAALEHVEGRQYVTIECPNGRADDRERIRRILKRDADQMSLEGPQFTPTVAFEDES